MLVTTDCTWQDTMKKDPGKELAGLQLENRENPEILGFTGWERQLFLINK